MGGGKYKTAAPTSISLDLNNYKTISSAVSAGYLATTSQSNVYQVKKDCILVSPYDYNSATIYGSFSNGLATNDLGEVFSYQIPLRVSTYVRINNNNRRFILPYAAGSSTILLDYTNIKSTDNYIKIIEDSSGKKIQAKKDIFIGCEGIGVGSVNNSSYSVSIRSSFITLREGDIYFGGTPSALSIKTFLEGSAIPVFDYTKAYTLAKAKDFNYLTYTVGTKTSLSNGLCVQKYSITAKQNLYLTTTRKEYSINNAKYTIGTCMPESLYSIYNNLDSTRFNQIYLTKNATYAVCYFVLNNDTVLNAIPNDTLVFIQ